MDPGDPRESHTEIDGLLKALHLAFLADHCRAAELSTIIGVGCFIARPMDACSRLKYRASRAPALSTTCSASADERAMERCRADAHITAPPCIMVTRPLVD